MSTKALKSKMIGRRNIELFFDQEERIWACVVAQWDGSGWKSISAIESKDEKIVKQVFKQECLTAIGLMIKNGGINDKEIMEPPERA